MKIIPATEAHVKEYYGNKLALPTMRAFVVIDDEEKLIGIGGFIRVSRGRWAIFSESKDGEREKHKLTALKFAKMLIKFADEKGFVLVADPAEDVPGSERFIRYLGFEPDEEGVYTRWPKWQQHYPT